MQLTVARTMDELQEALSALAAGGKKVGLVPTMGALHEGHLSLVTLAKTQADAVVATIFVNPSQFAPNEDFASYPRTLDKDLEKLDKAGVAVVYTPDAQDMYPPGFTTKVSVGPIGQLLEGQFRPHFFDGVATVVTKLLIRILPHVAVFGEKDYQQLCVIRRLVEDLDLPIEIVGGRTLREADGLAMSSRNLYLSKEERAVAPKLHETLVAVGAVLSGGKTAVKSALEQGVAALTKHGFKVDYLELRAADTLEPLNTFEAPARLLAAVWLGKTRLIDNIALE